MRQFAFRIFADGLRALEQSEYAGLRDQAEGNRAKFEETLRRCDRFVSEAKAALESAARKAKP